MAKPSPEVKTRFKMYKKGKLWLVAAAATAGLMAGGNVAQADNSTATSNSDQAVVANTNTGTSNDNNSDDNSTVALTTTTAVSNDSQVATASEDAVSTTANESTSATNTTQKATSSTDQAIDSASQASTEASKAAENVEQSTASATQDSQSNDKTETSSNAETDTVSMTTAAASASATDSVTKTTEVYSNGHWYLKDQNGKNLTGWQKLSGGRTVYYNAQGELVNGEQKINNQWYYFSTTNGNVAQGWTTLSDGRTVYYDVDANGSGKGMLYGMQTISGVSYYFNVWNGAEEIGFKQVDGKTYYFNPKMVTGIQHIGNYWYYFGADGVMKTGIVVLPSNGHIVYYNNAGQLQYGEQQINGKWYHFDKVDGHAAQGWYTLEDGRTVYYDVDASGNGQGMLHGLQTVAGKTYSFNVWTGDVAKNTEQKIDGSWYYFGNDGAMQTGFVTLNDTGNTRIVYYNSKGQMQNGWQTINGKTYYFNVWYGDMVKGESKIDGSWYYFGTDGVMRTGFVTLNDTGNTRTVYYNNKGQMQYGWQTINGKTYYFNVWTGDMAKNESKIGDYWYYFGNDGVMRTGFVTLTDTDKTRVVYYNTQGQLQYGQQTINSKTYYFNIWSGEEETGVVYNANTKLLQYYGESDGSLSNGTVTIGEKKYTLDNNGNIPLSNGENQVNGNWYLYDASAKKLKTGFQSVSSNRTVYYDPDTAIMVHGEKQIDGNWYYFDKCSGAETISNFVSLSDGRVVYYDDQGHMVHGEKQINGNWYYFNQWNGAEAISTFIKLSDGRNVYYDGQGHMLKGWQTINGNTFYFDLTNGNMYTGTHYIDGTKHTFDSDGVEDTWGWPFPADGRGYFTGAQLFGVNAGGEFRLNGFHDGLDFGSIDHPGYEVHAVHKGTVTGIGYASGLDWYVLIDTGEYLIVYQEAFSSRSNIWVSVGQQVNVGDVIGGRTTAHLHLGITRQKNFNVALANSFNNNGTWINPLTLLGN
ncbi:putative secreted protein [Limosilactobacillus mucosae]|nr:peptidoglycan DD-metalloendopeptidase family protein [Limosilactobacillus mucosae]PWJ45569.1 putative secreted protein [Limosilactobacillus mucosae]SUQ20922.1 KxYKxGKxW signal peptide containing protein [Limosilactobacillus mucosae]